MAQLVERVLGKDEVAGSNPASSSTLTPLQNNARGFVVNQGAIYSVVFDILKNSCLFCIKKV